MHYLEARNCGFNEPQHVELAAKIHQKLLDEGFEYAPFSTRDSWIESQIAGSIDPNAASHIKILHGINVEDEMIDTFVEEIKRILNLRKHIAFVKINRTSGIDPLERFELLVGTC